MTRNATLPNHRFVAAGIGGLLLFGATATACSDDDQGTDTTGTTMAPLGDGVSGGGTADETGATTTIEPVSGG